MFKKTTVTNVAFLALTLVALVFTSCTSGEELEKIARMNVRVAEPVVVLDELADEAPKFITVNGGNTYSYNAEDGNVITVQASNADIKELTINFGDVVGNSRKVTVTAFGTPNKLSRAENGSTEVIASGEYVQQVTAPQKDAYTYNVISKENSSDDNSKVNISYEVERYLNGHLDQSWKFNVVSYEYNAYSGSKNLYAAGNPDWKVALTLPEGDAVNSLGNEVKLDHGTRVAEKNVLAKVWKDGKFLSTDESAVTMTETEKFYYGDYTFCTTAGVRISCDGNYRLYTTSNVVFVDALTGHREVLIASNSGNLEMTSAKYVKNANASETISDSEGRIYDYVGDYTVSIDAKINGAVVCSSNTTFPTYSVR